MVKSSKQLSNEVETFEPKYTLRASIKHFEEQSSVSIHWHVEGLEKDAPKFKGYYVAMDALYSCVGRMRNALDVLQANTSIDKDGTLKTSTEDVQAVAAVGAAMFKEITQGRPGYPKDEQFANKFLEWFKKVVEPARHGDWRIQIEHSNFSGQTFPWGLIYSPHPKKSIDELSDDFNDYSGFWCLKYFLACSGPDQHRHAKKLPAAREFRLAAILEDDHANRQSIIEEGTVENVDSETFDDHLPGSRSDIRRISRQNKLQDQFWYFNLRAEENSPSYSFANSSVDTPSLENSILLVVKQSSEADRKIGFLLFDGDAVIRGDRGSEWISTILSIENAGLIAVETDINNPILKYFGWDFLKTILIASLEKKETNKPPQSFLSATYHARKLLWPHSLLYGMYSNPLHIYADPTPEALKRISDYLEYLKMQEAAK